MAEPRRWYLVTYDVRDPRRWRRVHRLVKGYGEPLQLSVFRCLLDNRDRERMVLDLLRCMEAEDSLLVIGLCRGYVERVRVINPIHQWPTEPAAYRIL